MMRTTSRKNSTLKRKRQEQNLVNNDAIETVMSNDNISEAPPRKRGRPKGSKTSTHPLIPRPKRPLSCYNIFFSEQRKLLMQENGVSSDDESECDEPNNNEELLEPSPYDPEEKKRPKKNHCFPALAKIVAERWKNADMKTKNIYKQKSKTLLAKYKKSMEEYNAECDEITKLCKEIKQYLTDDDDNEYSSSSGDLNDDYSSAKQHNTRLYSDDSSLSSLSSFSTPNSDNDEEEDWETLSTDLLVRPLLPETYTSNDEYATDLCQPLPLLSFSR